MSRPTVFVLLALLIAITGSSAVTCSRKSNGQYCGTNNDLYVCLGQKLQSDTSCSPKTCVTTGSTTAQCQDTYCKNKASGTYCDSNYPNSLTTCSGGSATVTACPAGDSCVVTGSTTAQCENTFCAGKSNGYYCSPSGLVTQCSGGSTVSSTACNSGSFCYDVDAVDVHQDGVLGSGGAATCMSNDYMNDLSACNILPGYSTGAYCNNSLVYECLVGVSRFSEVNPCPYGQVCWAPNNLNEFGNGYLCGAKSCAGKTLAGYYCVAGTTKSFAYCPGSSNILEQNVPVNLNGAFGTSFYASCTDGTTTVNGVTYAYPSLTL